MQNVAVLNCNTIRLMKTATCIPHTANRGGGAALTPKLLTPSFSYHQGFLRAIAIYFAGWYCLTMAGNEHDPRMVVKEVNGWLEPFCRERGVVYLAESYASLESASTPCALREAYTSDGVHLNRDGYAVLGGAMAAELEAQGVVGPQDRLLLLGDSITAGYLLERDEAQMGTGEKEGAHTGYTIGYWLETLIGCTTLNRGVCGDTTDGMATRLAQYFDNELDFTTVLVQGGANNCMQLFYGGRAEAVAQAIAADDRTIVELCERYFVTPVFLPMLPMNWG